MGRKYSILFVAFSLTACSGLIRADGYQQNGKSQLDFGKDVAACFKQSEQRVKDLDINAKAMKLNARDSTIHDKASFVACMGGMGWRNDAYPYDVMGQKFKQSDVFGLDKTVQESLDGR